MLIIDYPIYDSLDREHIKLKILKMALATDNLYGYVKSESGRRGGITMNEFAQEVMNKRVERTMNALKKHQMNPYFVQTKEEAFELIKSMIPTGSTVGVGGSVTLAEIGMLSELKQGNYSFINTQAAGLTPQQRHERYRECFLADFYLSSSNAVTEDGFLYNVDGRSNRVAALLYGPNQVVIVIGVNKIVRDLNEARMRNREIAAPANAMRLNRQTPCVITGTCRDCQSPDRICRNYVIMGPQLDSSRIHIIIVNESLGF